MAAKWFFKSRGRNIEDDYTWLEPGSGSTSAVHAILQQGYDGHRCFDLIDDESPNLLLYDDLDGNLVLLATKLIPRGDPADVRGRPIRVTLLGTAPFTDKSGCQAIIGVAVLALRDELAARIPIQFGTGQDGGGFSVDQRWSSTAERAGAELTDTEDEFLQLEAGWLFPDAEEHRRHVAAELTAKYDRSGLASLTGGILVLRTNKLDFEAIRQLRLWRLLSDLKPMPTRLTTDALPVKPDRNLFEQLQNLIPSIPKIPGLLLIAIVIIGGGIGTGVAFSGGGSSTSSQPSSLPPSSTSPPPTSPSPQHFAAYAWGESTGGDLGGQPAGNQPGYLPDGVNLSASIATNSQGTGSQLATGAGYSLAVTKSGGVVAWGSNKSGQLGNGSTQSQSAPGDVTKLTGITGVSAGCLDALAVDTSGRVWAWGANNVGQLGFVATQSPTDHPVRVHFSPRTKAIAVSAGCTDSLALTSRNHVLAWGANSAGQLGNGSTRPSAKPVRVRLHLPGSAKIIAISAGCSTNLALANDGSLYSWGKDTDGLLGDGQASGHRSTPAPVNVPVTAKTGKIIAISAGCDHNLALTKDGTVFAWGSDAHGQLGVSERIAAKATFVKVNNLPSGVIAICAADNYSLALTSSGKVLAWGANNLNQLGTGNKADNAKPVPVTFAVPVSAIGAGPMAQHSLAIPKT